MKSKFLILFSLVSLIGGALSVPTELHKRDTTGDAILIVSQLYRTVQSYTAVINSTTAWLNSSRSYEQEVLAAEAIKANIARINAAVVNATEQIIALPKSSLLLAARQAANPLDLAGVVSNLLLDISGALNRVIASLGLTATLSFLGPLVGSLSGLLLSLVPVVNNLLELVRQLLSGLLIGLAGALSGLIL